MVYCRYGDGVRCERQRANYLHGKEKRHPVGHSPVVFRQALAVAGIVAQQHTNYEPAPDLSRGRIGIALR